MGRDVLRKALAMAGAGFNPRARMGRDSQMIEAPRGPPVSIHAPAWGATNTQSGMNFAILFQSTRPHGARQQPQKQVPPDDLFQSTRPHGARRGRWITTTTTSRFNPRARMGRDAPSRMTGRAMSCFNPRARMGRDIEELGCRQAAKMFQSTRPHGARQPRCGDNGTRSAVSIHAPAWGATKWRRRLLTSVPVSIHAPAWGATCRIYALCQLAVVSIHAPAWGATPARLRRSPARACFNPRARMGRDATANG